MRERKGNIWTFQTGDNWIVVATNGQVKSDGQAIMGKGIALEAAERYPELPAALGKRLTVEGNHVFLFCTFGLITFPTKEEYYRPSSIKLIEIGLKSLVNIVNDSQLQGEILLPRLGCGNGRLQWGTVRPLVANYLKSDQFIIFSR